MARVGGIIQLIVNGERQKAKGEFTYNLGGEQRTSVAGVDEPHGFKTEVRVPMCEGTITDRQDLDLAALQMLENATVQLDLANGKTVVFQGAYYSGSGNAKTGEGEIEFKIEAQAAAEV